MPQFAANLSLMYTEHPFLDRFAVAARDGFKAVELSFPYAYATQDIAARLREHGLQMVLLNAPAAGEDRAGMSTAWAQGERGTAALPGREAEFRAGVFEALRYAEALDCPLVNVLTGVVPASLSRESLQPACVARLQWAAEQAAQSGRTLVIEPANLRDIPRYFLNRQDHAHELLDAAQSEHLKVVMDLYHCQIVEGDLAAKLQRYLPTGRVAHLQIASVPGRKEPHQGELCYPFLLAQMDALGYRGWVGCEYRSGTATSAPLGWRPAP